MISTEHFSRPAIQNPAQSQTQVSTDSINALTGVRILAALWVLVSHLDLELFALFPVARVLEPLIASGMLGVDVFFILSGFIISYNYAARFAAVPLEVAHLGRSAWWPMYLRFLWLRMARLYPVHLVTLLAVLGMYLASQVLHVKLNLESGYGAIDFVRNLFLLHAWGSYSFNWNGPAWSISAEWFAYLLFPVFAVFTARVKANWQLAVMLLVLLILPLANLWHENNPLLNILHLVRVSTEFLAGCFLYRLHARGAGSSMPWSILTPLAGLLSVAVAALLWSLGMTLFWVAPLLALFIYGVAQQRGAFTSSLAGPQMIFWGQVSYSLYMTHSLVRTVLRKALPFTHFVDASLLVRVGLLGLYIICFAAVAALTYMLVEEPVRRLMRNKSPV
jgi:peptidoglycan/LPS O-acetylase OafA/YrhL